MRRSIQVIFVNELYGGKLLAIGKNFISLLSAIFGVEIMPCRQAIAIVKKRSH
jgi:hypothetical protein